MPYFKPMIYLFSSISLLLLLNSCKPSVYPKHPDYSIKKPKVIYTPNKRNLDKMVKKLQGSPYVWAEEGPDHFDCSGFTYYMYGSMGIEIPRVARNQAKVGKRIDVKDLQYGDLIFFATNKNDHKKITHVGMYLGDGWFTHASTAKEEVVYSNLFTSPYYKKRLRICRRYLPSAAPTHVASATPWKRNEALPRVQAQPQPVTKKTIPLQERTPKTTSIGKAIVIKSPMKDIEQRSSQGNFYVQVGSFIGNPDSNLLHAITRKGFHYKLIQFPKEGKSVSKLLIGPYATKDEARTIVAKVREKIQKDAFIAEIR
ncbi:NlpC/P60 family protein [Sulfurovum sp.]|uniref:NlpC/P60 family protein n=1 Tax=Sulfurovum sp. TaxID=1969726 RepID=UPI0025D2A262|nr:NlpC/P60 family protein [Sulfurovum sp.]